MMPDQNKEWFEEWFESPFYDLLYAKRNEEEAAAFIDNLLELLKLPLNLSVLDLACGKGRHSVYLHKRGYNVVGLDLSVRSINYARSFEKEGLDFIVQDMREPLSQRFDLVVNLFTSFGYFDSEAENLKVLLAVKSMLKSGGIFILDYLNGQKIPSDLNYFEEKKYPEVDFKIHKTVKNGFVVKDIELTSQNQTHAFCEKVRLYNNEDFTRLFEKAGFDIVQIFGDYRLNSFDPRSSDRLIYITTVKN